MNVEIINTGTELMLGAILNTHQQWLCRELAQLGYTVTRQTAVPDSATAIENAVRESLGRVRLVITTGGLGPTSDDITRDRIAALLGRQLHEDPAIVRHIEAFFASRHRHMPPSTRVQALIPDGAVVLHNANGTAPGLALEVPGPSVPAPLTNAWLIMLPGPPRELHPMFRDKVVPLLRRVLPPERERACRVFRTTGMGESMVEERIAPLLDPLVKGGLELGYCARVGEVDVRIVAHGPTAVAVADDAERIIRSALGDYIVGTGGDSMEAVIVQLLKDRGQTLALAESCTGGYISHRVTNVPGASAVLLAGLVTYSNHAKQELLGVGADLLAAHGAVSEPVAIAMARGARARTGADWAISVTGIAGPSGGSPAKPVGTVFMALTGPDGDFTHRRMNPFDRETFKYATSQQALDLLRRSLLGLPLAGS